MAFTGNFVATSFKQEVLEGVHDLRAAGATQRIALYTSSATLNAATTAYSSTNEVSGAGYTATGAALTVSQDPTISGTTAYMDYIDPSWAASTITARGALIYNDTVAGDPAILVLDFGTDKSTTAQTFTVQIPTADATNAILRFA